MLFLLRETSGIFIVRSEVIQENENDSTGHPTRAFHFYGIDSWRRVIYDNDKDPTVRYCQWDSSDFESESTAKDLFRGLGVQQILEVYTVKVLARRAHETTYV